MSVASAQTSRSSNAPKGFQRSRRPKSKGNNKVYTGYNLAFDIVCHFQPSGNILEPCRGTGDFYRAIKELTGSFPEWCETDQSVLNGENPRDFLTYQFSGKFDWIITNPPFSGLTDWLRRCFELSDNVVLLIEAPAYEQTARERLAADAGFGVKEVYRVPTPEHWKKKYGGPGKGGIGLAVVHWQKGWGDVCTRSKHPEWRNGFNVAPEGDGEWHSMTPEEVFYDSFFAILGLMESRKGLSTWEEVPNDRREEYEQAAKKAWDVAREVIEALEVEWRVHHATSMAGKLAFFWYQTAYPDVKPLDGLGGW